MFFAGAIPGELCKASSLERLHVQCNGLKGTINKGGPPLFIHFRGTTCVWSTYILRRGGGGGKHGGEVPNWSSTIQEILYIPGSPHNSGIIRARLEPKHGSSGSVLKRLPEV